MKQFLCLLILVFSISTVWAEDKYIKVRANFLKQDGDSIAFIEKELLFEAYLKAIDVKLKNLNLNSALFWSKFEESLNEKYANLEESLKAKYKITETSTAKQVKRYKKVLRVKKLVMRRKHKQLRRLITSYANQKYSKSPRNPDYRILKLEAKVNERLLTQFYYKMIKGKSESEYGTLYIKTNFNFKNFDLSEIGVEAESKIANVVNKNWLNWFLEAKSMNIGQVELLTAEKEKQLTEFTKFQSTSLEVPTTDFKNSLLLDIEMNILKREYVSEFKQYILEYTGAAYLKEIETGRVVTAFDFSSDKKRYQILEGMSISNIIANHVFKMARGYFPSMNRKVKEVTPNMTSQTFTVENYSNISSVYKIMEDLRNRGIQFTMQPKIVSINSSKAKIKVFFEGKVEQLLAVLRGMKESEGSTNFTLIDTEGQISIKLN